MQKTMKIAVFFAILLLAAPMGEAGLLAYGICQTGCNVLAGACYTAGGSTFGTVTGGAGAPAVIIGCNAGLGECMAACVAAGLTPIP